MLENDFVSLNNSETSPEINKYGWKSRRVSLLEKAIPFKSIFFRAEVHGSCVNDELLNRLSGQKWRVSWELGGFLPLDVSVRTPEDKVKLLEIFSSLEIPQVID